MLNQYFSQLLVLVKRLLLVYVAYFVCRLLFFFFNKSYFPEITFFDFFSISFFALRFDTFSIFACNSLFILLSSLPFNFSYHSIYQKIQLWVFTITNSVFLLFNLIDIAYFPYIKKRSTADILKQAGGQTDLSTLLPQYLKEYWYVLLIFIALIIFLVYFYKKIKNKPIQYTHNLKHSTALLLVWLFACSLTVLGIRGGFQRVPIDVVDAGLYTTPKNISLLVNSPFTILKSMDKDELKPLNFEFKNPSLEQVYNPVQTFNNKSFQKLNVVVIMLESFAKEYTKLGKIKSYTPFLDSLMDYSLTFSNAFSNGHKSIEGIPAIVSSMPSLMENPIINSTYANNIYESFPTHLKPEGYTCAFFHGGTNGTMNFDSYALQAGYDYYYGRTEYNNDADFDGFWGITDEPFYYFSIKKMSEMKQPFHSAIFSLSSHHPYFIPEKLKNKFPKGTLENHESIGYADYALKKFFEEAKKQSWYSNTIFVISADHSSLSNHPFYSNLLGQFTIPIIFYKPDNSLKKEYKHVFQQTDILPSVLDYLGYNKPFFSFGKTYKDTTNRFAVYYTNSTHFFITDSLLLNFSDFKLNNLINYRRDSLLAHPLPLESVLNREKRWFEAFIQTYNNRLINNTCSAK